MVEEGKRSNILIGIAGEYFVAGELSRRGYTASLTLKNTRGVDVLVSDASTSRTLGIQVKAKYGRGRDWILNESAERYFGKNLFYIFVNLGDEKKRPDFFVVPSHVVARSIKAYHKQWLETPGRGGRQHRDNPMRKFRDKPGKYLEKWHLLGLGTSTRK